MNLNKHKMEEEKMDMTPMIDVVFLLIIFFMLISDMTQHDPAQGHLGRAG